MLRALLLMWLGTVGGIIFKKNYNFVLESDDSLLLQSSVSCLHSVELEWLTRNEFLTRSSNLAIAYIHNDSFPALKISEEYIKFKNNFATNSSQDTYLVRVFSSADEYVKAADGMLSSILLIDYYVIITDSVDDIRFIIESYLRPAPSWNPGARFLILYNNQTNQNRAVKTAKAVFDILLTEFYIHKVIMMYSLSVTNYSIHSFDPFDMKNCRKVVVENASSCDDGIIQNRFTFLHHINRFQINTTLKNCVLKLCISVTEPYINADCKSGIEMSILEILEGKLKFEVSF